jgi:anti-sigma-K factor RskA
MNYLTEQRKNALAAEYVLGTLQGRARIRFQKLLMQHQALREALWAWECHLNGLGSSLPDSAPDPIIWQKIQARLGFNPMAANDADSPAAQNTEQPDTSAAAATITNVAAPISSQTAKYWQWLAALSSAAAVILAVALVWPIRETPIHQQQQPAALAQVAVIQSAKAEALWLITLDGDNLKIQANAQLPAQNNNDYELWIVAKDGRAPISLGLLPQQGQITLPRAAVFDQLEIAALAVSLEPLGGSPNGSPTTVLYSAQLLSI